MRHCILWLITAGKKKFKESEEICPTSVLTFIVSLLASLFQLSPFSFCENI